MKYKVFALILVVVMIVIIGSQLIDFTAFVHGTPAGTLYDAGAWEEIGDAIADILWSYRAIDVLIQATLLLAAVMGASAMVRAYRKGEE